MKVIQISGTNGTGKTTLIKSLIQKSNFMRLQLPEGNEIKYWNYDGRIAIIGTYDNTNCCGVDKGTVRAESLFGAILFVIRQAPEVILFESVIYGSSYKFRKRVADTCLSFGIQYINVILFAKPEIIVKRICERTGRNADFDAIMQKGKQVISGGRKLHQEGVPVYWLGTGCIQRQRLLTILEYIVVIN